MSETLTTSDLVQLAFTISVLRIEECSHVNDLLLLLDISCATLDLSEDQRCYLHDITSTRIYQ